MINKKTAEERAKEYDQIITMQKIMLQAIFRNSVSIGGKPVTLDLNESQRVALNRVGVKVDKQEQQQPPKFKIGDRVTVLHVEDPIKGFWKVISVRQSGGKTDYRLAAFDEPSNTFDWTSEKYLEPYIELERVPIFHDDPFTNGDIVQIVKPRDHSEATGKPWIVTGRFSDNTATISRFGVEPWLPANDKTVPVEILAKFPLPKYSDGQLVVIDDGEPGTYRVKSARLTEHGGWLYELQSANSEQHLFGSVEERDLKPYAEPATGPKFRGGDTVTVKRRNGHWTVDLVVAPDPEIGRTEFIYDVRIDVGSLLHGDTSYRICRISESELELVEPTEPVTFQFEVGDTVRIKATGALAVVDHNAGNDWWMLNGEKLYPTSQLEFVARPKPIEVEPAPAPAPALQGAFYDTEEPALFDPELVMTRTQRDELMDCLYGNDAKGWEPEIILARIMNLFPQPE